MFSIYKAKKVKNTTLGNQCDNLVSKTYFSVFTYID